MALARDSRETGKEDVEEVGSFSWVIFAIMKGRNMGSLGGGLSQGCFL